MNENGTIGVQFTGGEPLLHPDIDKIIDFASNKFKLVRIITNGSLLKNHVNAFKNMSNLVLQLSLHSSDKNYYENFIGVNNQYENVKNNIKLVVDNNINHFVTLLITPKIYDSFNETVEMLYEMNVKSVRIDGVDNLGRASEELVIYNIADLPEINKKINNVGSNYPDGFVLKLSEHFVDNVNRNNCAAGSKYITISYDGTIKFCNVCDNVLSIDNIFKDSYPNIFNRITDCRIDKIQEPVRDICGNCDDYDHCNLCMAIRLNEYFLNNKKCKWIKHNKNHLNKISRHKICLNIY
ncbi:MAG: radical SAM protein [Methanobrevibacter sp.]|nr:radical SAM protein [Methanobrevibacter sp.]